tara:strand:- start:1631 stop:1861 length:231 start_codon:yes stop_codon:yes gene_type:complete
MALPNNPAPKLIVPDNTVPRDSPSFAGSNTPPISEFEASPRLSRGRFAALIKPKIAFRIRKTPRIRSIENTIPKTR